MEKGASVTDIDSGEDQLWERRRDEYGRDSPCTWKGYPCLDAQSRDQGRGTSATSQQVGCGDEVGDALALEKDVWMDIRVEYERAGPVFS